MRKQKAREWRRKMNATLAAARKLIRVDELSEEELADMRDLYPLWVSGAAYKKGDIVSFGHQLYETIQAHTSQDDWTPDTVPALFNLIQPPGVIPEWVQPTGGHDAYATGDKVIYEGSVYESLIDGNTWNPTEYPQGWKLVEGA